MSYVIPKIEIIDAAPAVEFLASDYPGMATAARHQVTVGTGGGTLLVEVDPGGFGYEQLATMSGEIRKFNVDNAHSFRVSASGGNVFVGIVGAGNLA